MNYRIISDNNDFAQTIVVEHKSFEFEDSFNSEKSKVAQKIKCFDTRGCSFGALSLLSELYDDSRDTSAVTYIINTELTYAEQDKRSDLPGIELAVALRCTNKIRNDEPIILFGFLPEDKVKEKLAKIYSHEAGYENILRYFDFSYFRLPLENGNKIKIPVSEFVNFDLIDEKRDEVRRVSYRQLPEYHPIGVIDDHASHFKCQLEVELNKEESNNQIYKVIDFPYDMNLNYNGNELNIFKWLKSSEILDIVLLDINYDQTGNEISKKDKNVCPICKKEFTSKENIDENKLKYVEEYQQQQSVVDNGGINILKHLKVQYGVMPTSIAIFSVTKNKENLKKFTNDFGEILSGYVAVESTDNSHSKREIRNIGTVSQDIKDILRKEGAYHNKVGVLLSHGTDTMAWTLSLLQYCVKDLKCSIALTGSQISLKSEFAPSDAPDNMISALYYLNQFVNPQIGVAFDMGKKFLGNNLKKVNIWDVDAFDGEIIARYNWDEMETEEKLLSYSNCLDELYLLRTGGTIAMSKSGGTSGKPSFSAMEKFFKSESSKYRNPEDKKMPLFAKFISKEVVRIDSSEMNPLVYSEILQRLKDINNKNQIAADIEELKEDSCRVYPILCSPFTSKTLYQKYLDLSVEDKPSVFILIGFGAGNIPYQYELKVPEERNDKEHEIRAEEKKKHEYSPMDFAIDAIAKNNIVILTSQVQHQIPDVEYEVAGHFINEGVLFAGDMSLAEIMIKCAYLLGHYDSKTDDLKYLKSAIMAGVQFRSQASKKKMYRRIKELKDNLKYIIPDKNYFKTEKTYDSAKERIKNRLKAII
ncbi:MAG: asparaginase domain-containing protein [Tannerella sp.]|jgi:L-asparaginase/Glu-tRNA(Gln) amidotransferase subunit D|nr:asparaginase domain-containing protein [Tannerella sp.]